ncbi:hypothetical protein ACFWMG_11285 [Streptomyces sp. NPDC127074]|uniref:hypothetical protein n=1 Tax=Streptomyces sp. NPDC127074 TaxID=3347130 RepID=UPI003659EA37
MNDPVGQRQAAFDALRSAEEAGGNERTDRLLRALTHAVLALSEPDDAVTVPPTGAPRAMQLLVLMRSSGGVWDGKRTLAAYKVLGIETEGNRLLEPATARRDLIALADAGLIRRLDRSSSHFTADEE